MIHQHQFSFDDTFSLSIKDDIVHVKTKNVHYDIDLKEDDALRRLSIVIKTRGEKYCVQPGEML